MLPADLQNFPLLDDSGAAMLRFLREQPHAPRYTHVGCDRLNAAGLERVRAFDAELQSLAGGRLAPLAGFAEGIADRAAMQQLEGLLLAGWRHRQVPDWLREFAAACYRDVPFYRADGSLPDNFFDIPPCSRDDLQREPWSFVPDALPLDDLVIYQTSGTTGHPLDILTHPEPLAIYVPLLRAALATRGVRLAGETGRVAIVCVCFQRRTWTYAAVSPALAQAGYAKINLNPADWRAPSDREAFLDACDAQLYTGDPLSFMELSRLPLQTRPRALISTALALSTALRRVLEERFSCPVFDLYSTNETGPIAVATYRDGARPVAAYKVGVADPAVAAGTEGTFELLQPRLYVEILDAEGNPCPPGTRGEVAVSGGFNPFLPLLRYRTGDYARLAFPPVAGEPSFAVPPNAQADLPAESMQGGRPVLVGLEGRPPVVFRGATGQVINNIDISNALKPFGLAQFALHQAGDGTLRLRVRGGHPDQPLTRSGGLGGVRAALLDLFGASQLLTFEELNSLATTGDKLIQYTRAE